MRQARKGLLGHTKKEVLKDAHSAPLEREKKGRVV